MLKIYFKSCIKNYFSKISTLLINVKMIGFVKDKKKMTIIIQKHILQYVILFENTNIVVSSEI